ncbi:uncharacterized protein TNCV_2193481 [Trichonephila clavipes]|nr:uncharacterized protein TNCV_2193481 [Trichonephila clavipes]
MRKLTEFEEGRVLGLREGGFSLSDNTKRFHRNVSTVYDSWKQWSRDGTALKQDFWCPRGTTEREDRHMRRKAVTHCSAFELEIRTAVGTTVTQGIVRNRLLEGQL